MNWKRKFRDVVLSRGRAYYSRNRVQGLRLEQDIYKADVIGERVYHVEVKIQGEQIPYMSCSCPHAADGNYCKHMAAVLFAIEEQHPVEKPGVPIEEKIRPFSPATEGYQYFDLGKILQGIEVEENLFEDAKKLIKDGMITLEEVNIEHRNRMQATEISGTARGACASGRFSYPIYVIFDREKVLVGNCGVPGCVGHYEDSRFIKNIRICKHLLAMFLLLEEYLVTYNPGDTTDRDGEYLLEGFREQHMMEVMQKQTRQVQDFTLTPILERTYDGPVLAFKAGTDRLYVVQNLTELVQTYEAQGVMTFGTKTHMDFGIHRLEEESRTIYTYVKDIVNAEISRNEHSKTNYHYYESPQEIKGKIELYGKRLDDFYDLFEHRSINGNDKTGGRNVKKTYLLEDGKPNVSLTIEGDVDGEQVFHGVKVQGKVPAFIRGTKYNYYFSTNAFCRINEEMAREIQPILDLGEYGNFHFQIGRKHLSQFYHQILPIVRRHGTVEEIEPEKIQEYIPPEAVFAFYLDAEHGNISCKPKARYGVQEVSLTDCMNPNGKLELFRDRYREEEMLYYLQEFFSVVDYEKEEIRCGNSDETKMRLIDGGVERLMAYGEVHTTDRFRNLNIRKQPAIKVGVSIESDLMNLSISSEDIDTKELLSILQNYERKKKYYRLKNGDFIAVNEEDMEMLLQMMDTLQLSPKEFVKGNMKIPLYRALYLNKMLEQGENIYSNRDRHFKNLIKEFKTIEDSEFDVPASLEPVMRHYQVQGFKWLKTLERYGFGGILADDMGLGKTLQMISVLVSAKENGEQGPALIVSPASLVYNWKAEFARFAPSLSVVMVVGTQSERSEIIHNYKAYDVLVTSYDLLKRDVAEYEETEFAYQILDEAQYIKNHSTAAAKSVKVIHSKHRYALTGTPIENRLSELWSIFDYLMPGFLYSYETFRKEMESPIVKNQDEEASLRLRKMVAPFILRRLKQEVLKDLPDKIEEVRYARMEEEQQKLYDAQVVHMREMVAKQNAEEFQKNKLQILSELTRIRQICCDPELLFDRYKGGSAKRMACMELIQSAIEGEHKILVFSQFTSMLEVLERDLEKAGISFYKITGATAKETRMELVNAFNHDNIPVFLISLKAGGTGLNLTGADVVIHYDPWWNQAVQNQATDRAHRIGQTKVVSVYKIIAKDTIEEKIVQMQESKRDLADRILSGETGSITKMSKEELLELLM